MAGNKLRHERIAALEAAGGMEHVCDQLIDGKSLREIARSFELWPMQLLRWIEEDDNRRLQYARARDAQAEAFASELVSIADEVPGMLENGATDSGAVAHAKLRIDTRKWVASKLKPGTYGDKLAVGGAADLPPIQTNATLDPSDAYKALLEGKS